METLDDKKLRGMAIWFSNYVNTLDKVVKDNGDIYFHETGDRFFMVLIDIDRLECLVEKELCEKISVFFSLEYEDFKSFIAKWVEDTYQLKHVEVRRGSFPIP